METKVKELGSMTRIAVCDDNEIQLAIVKEFLQVYQENNPALDLQIQYYMDSVALLDDIAKSGNFDVYILDVVMPLVTGIELGDQIRSLDKQAALIYITGSGDFAVDAFRVRASGYLLKPVEMEKLYVELDIALAQVKKNSDKWFQIRTKEGVMRLPIESIQYGEWWNHTLTFTLTGDKEVRSVTLRESMDKVIAPLLAEQQFVRPHQSYVVNQAYVRQMEGRQFHMKNGYQIPISQGLYPAIKRSYLEYCKKSGKGQESLHNEG